MRNEIDVPKNLKIASPEKTRVWNSNFRPLNLQKSSTPAFASGGTRDITQSLSAPVRDVVSELLKSLMLCFL